MQDFEDDRLQTLAKRSKGVHDRYVGVTDGAGVPTLGARAARLVRNPYADSSVG